MSAGYLLDTNTASYIIRGHPPLVRSRLLTVPIERITISSITEAELRHGGARKPDAHALHHAINEFILRVTVLAWNSDAAKYYAQSRAELNAKGISLSAMDMLIAAHALATNSILVSSDSAFKQVPDLLVEDWTQAAQPS